MDSISTTQEPLSLLYESTRNVCISIGRLIGFLIVRDICNEATCPEMKADQWQYLCASHAQPNSCSALDYCVHTLDASVHLLTSIKHFPSRTDIPSSAITHFQHIFRRLYRIFAHVYFEHTSIFYEYEQMHGSYQEFLDLIKKWNLIPQAMITIP